MSSYHLSCFGGYLGISLIKLLNTFKYNGVVMSFNVYIECF